MRPTSVPSALGGREANASLTALIRVVSRRVTGSLRRWLVAARTDGRRRIVLAFDLDGPPTPGIYCRVEFRELSAAEIAERRELLGPGVGTLVAGSTDGGCVVGMEGGRQVYHAWYIRGEGRHWRDMPDSWSPRGRVLFLYDGYTEPAYRGRGIHSAATRWMLERERGSDVTHAVCVVHEDNAAAYRAVRKLGFRPLGRIT